MKVLDLFSGIGGFALGFHMADPKFQTVGFVEQDEYCQKILALRFPEVPIYNDIKTFDPTEFIGTDIVCGAKPVDNKGSMMTAISGTKCSELLKLLNHGLLLEKMCEALLMSPWGSSVASLTWKILATKTKLSLFQLSPSMPNTGETDASLLVWPTPTSSEKRDNAWGGGEAVADTNGTRSTAGLSRQNERQKGNSREFDNGSNQQSRWSESYRWPDEPNIPRISHGVPNRVDRLKCIGNSIIPAIAMHIGRAIIEASR